MFATVNQEKIIMPIYEYQCTDCREKFDARRSFAEAESDAVCPRCGKTGKRILSKFACCSKDGSGGTVSSIAGTGGGCAGCTSGSCSSCHS